MKVWDPAGFMQNMRIHHECDGGIENSVWALVALRLSVFCVMGWSAVCGCGNIRIHLKCEGGMEKS